MIPVALSGSAVGGIGRHFCATTIDALPQTVYLGRTRPKARPQALRLASYASQLNATGLPAKVDYYSKAAPSIARMYRNDVKGCCVITDRMHSLGIWSANDPDSGGVILATDAEVDEQYSGICGPGDRGCVITDVLDVAVSRGIKAGGKYYKIDGYVSIDWTSKDLTKAALELFGTLCVGINLPNAWTQNSIWDTTNTAIVGGHDVPGCGFGDGAAVLNTNSDGVVIASWGRLYLITWRAWLSTRWLEECYCPLSPNWYNSDKIAASGVTADELKADLAKLSRGILPDTPDPNVDPPMDWFA